MRPLLDRLQELEDFLRKDARPIAAHTVHEAIVELQRHRAGDTRDSVVPFKPSEKQQ